MSYLGKNIRYLRKKNRWSQEKLGTLVGKSESAIQMWETEYRSPTMGSVKDLAELFNVDINDLVTKDLQDNNDSPSQWGNHEANLKYLEDKPELLSIYNDIVTRDEIYLLFDKTKDLEPKDVESVLMFVQTIRKQRGMDE